MEKKLKTPIFSNWRFLLIILVNTSIHFFLIYETINKHKQKIMKKEIKNLEAIIPDLMKYVEDTNLNILDIGAAEGASLIDNIFISTNIVIFKEFL